MMVKGVLEIVSDPDPGFYSCPSREIFGQLAARNRPVAPERVHQTPFRMETPNSVLLAVRKNHLKDT